MTHVYLPNINVQFVNEAGKLSEAGYRFLYFLWERTGGHEDSVTTSGSETFTWTTSPSTGLSDVKFISTAASYTTQGNSIVVATAVITITLNPYPIDGEKVTIKRAVPLGLVTVNGGGNNIDGASTYTIVTNYEAAQCIYSAIDGEWFII